MILSLLGELASLSVIVTRSDRPEDLAIPPTGCEALPLVPSWLFAAHLPGCHFSHKVPCFADPTINIGERCSRFQPFAINSCIGKASRVLPSELAGTQLCNTCYPIHQSCSRIRQYLRHFSKRASEK